MKCIELAMRCVRQCTPAKQEEVKCYCYGCIYHMHPGELPPSDIKQARTKCGNLDSPYYGQIVSITHACDCGVPFATGGFVDKIQIVPTNAEKGMVK